MEKIHPTPPTPPKYSSPSSNAIALSVVAFNNNSIPPWSPHTTTNQSTPLFGEEPRGPMPNMHSRATKTSIYRGVTRHKWTGRYEAHLWDKNCWDEKRNKKGRQVYLGAYKIEEDAARAYDIASLKYWGVNAITNFPVQTYAKEYMQMQMLSKNQLLANIRRRSSGFARGASRYRGVTRHHQNGRWEARISRVNGNKYLYLGTFDTEEQAAQAYDLACIEYRGARAITNFDANLYIRSPQVAPVQPFPHRIAQESIQPLSVPQLPQQQHHLSPTNLAPLATTNAQVQAADVPVLDVNMFEDVFDDLTWDLSTEITFDQCDADANVVAASADEIDSMLQELLHNDLFSESNGSFLLEPELKNASGPTSVSVMDQDGCNVQNMANEGPSSATSSSGAVN